MHIVILIVKVHYADFIAKITGYLNTFPDKIPRELYLF